MNVFPRRTLKLLLGLLIPFSVLLALPLPIKAQSVQSPEGLYQVQGNNSEHGEYAGQAWIRGNQVQRVIRWASFRSQNKQVESIWTGTLSSQTLEFSLGISNVLTSFDGFAPPAEDFQAPIKVSLPRSLVLKTTSFEVKGEGHYSETWRRIGEAPEAPLWVDLRKVVEGVGGQGTFVIKIARWLGINKVIQWYRDNPKAQAYKDHPEFRDKKQYFILDKTDADFYAKNPEVLRVTNKTLNPLSLAEALMRRNAYAPTLEQKAEFLERQTVTNNLNSAGLLELAVVDAKGNKVNRIPEYDAGLWTGMFAWAEVMRYQATKDPQALIHFRRVLDGILTMVEITGDSSEFARTLAVSPVEENLGEGWIQGRGPWASLKWRQGGNNDMIKGVFVTLALAHQVVGPHENELRARIKKVSKALLELKAVKERGFNTGIAHGILALWTQDEEQLQKFSGGVLNLQTVLSNVTKVEDGFYMGGIADWSGIHLTMVSTLCQILISQELMKVFPYNEKGYLAAQTLKSAEARLRVMKNSYKLAHRDFLTVMTYAFSEKARKDKGFKAEAEEALWTLKEVPTPRKIGNASIDLSKFPNWSLSAWPRLPWKAIKGFRKLKEDLDFNYYAQGAYSYPLFETLAWQTTYLWKDMPFNQSFASNPQVESFSSDYLMLYWSARVSGLLPAGK